MNESLLLALAARNKGGSGGGGVSSWNDLTDKPFYSEYGITEIPVPLLATDDDGDGVNDNFFVTTNLNLTIGETYTIVWNGVEYTSIALDMYELSGGQENGIFVGNTVAVEGEDTGEPYVLMVLPQAMMTLEDGTEVFGVAMPLDGSTDVILSIKAEGEIVHPIDPKYLPNTSQTVGACYLYGATGDINYLYNSSDTTNDANRTTLAQLKEILASGKMVWFASPGDYGDIYTPCHIVISESQGYGMIYIGIPGMSATNATYFTAEYTG